MPESFYKPAILTFEQLVAVFEDILAEFKSANLSEGHIEWLLNLDDAKPGGTWQVSAMYRIGKDQGGYRQVGSLEEPPDA